MPKKEEDIKYVVKREVDDEDDSGNDDNDDLNWWEQENIQFSTKGEKRWNTLSHNGVMFPPEYEPHGIPILYEGKEFVMTPEEEEVATMFAVMKEHDYYRTEIFRRNFFSSWREILDKRTHPIRRLELCDFEPIYQWHLREREKKLSRTKEEKKELKLRNEKEAEPFRTCLWDDKVEQVANFRVEPPGLFRGRGKHPLMGRLKTRVQPEDITINIDEVSPIPDPPAGHHWKEIVHDHNVTWLAMWRDSILGNFKYVMLAPSSSIKGQSDMLKFEKARKLKDHVGTIRETYESDFDSRDSMVAQRAVAMYLIDKLALRVGNEKGSDEADTVGCCSLRVEHIELLPDNVAKFDFLGKDSIRYTNQAVVLPKVHELMKRFIRGKKPSEDIFDKINPSLLNEYLKSFMPDLSAKVFRTYNASITLDRWFHETPVDSKASLPEKLAYFNRANTEVAILCNHQKSVSKNHRKTMQQLTAKSDYTRQMIDALERAKVTMKKKSLEDAVKDFFAEQDEIQYKWLEAYGTDEQRSEFDEIVKSRGKPSVKSSRTKSVKSEKSTKAGTTKKSAKKSAKKAAKKSAKKAAKKTAKKAAKKTSKKSSGKSEKKKSTAAKSSKKIKEESDDEDTLLTDIINKKNVKSTADSKKKKASTSGSKRSRKGKPKHEDEESDDDNVPIGALC